MGPVGWRQKDQGSGHGGVHQPNEGPRTPPGSEVGVKHSIFVFNRTGVKSIRSSFVT